MQFYKVPAANGQPERLEATQADARAACKERGLKASDFSDYDVRTDKAGLLAHLNELLARQVGQPKTIVLGPNAAPVVHVVESERKPFVIEDDEPERNPLHPPYESPWGARSVLADMDVNAMCKCIRQIDGTRLGKVATATVERMEALRKEIERDG